MENLPVELLEQIIAHLLPRRARTSLIEVPISQPQERSDVYTVRSTNRRLHSIAWPLFMIILEDKPTKCTESSLQNLGSLVAIPAIGDRLTCLTIDTGRASQLAFSRQDAQILDSELRSIISKAPNVRHLVCQPGTTYEAKQSSPRRWLVPHHAWEVIQKILTTTCLNNQLETLHFLSTAPSALDDLIPVLQAYSRISFPRVKHLTVCAAAHDLSFSLSEFPGLKSLNIILFENDEENVRIESRGPKLSDTKATVASPVLQTCTFRARQDLVSVDTLLSEIELLLGILKALPLLIIQGMTIVADISFDKWEWLGSGRTSKIVFDDVGLCWTDEITNSGPSDPKPVGTSSKLVCALRERADEVVILPPSA